MDSKEVSWKYVTADELLCKGACDLLYALSHPSGNDSEVVFYDGESSAGTKIAGIFTDDQHSQELAPPVPIYCRKGLYVDDISRLQGTFVMWRPRPSKEG